mmetsp:Transcript_118838/g.296357  ORF Transcript_118838/g.296357 Transcript_118838/m.296357 type:complete len:292 (-) Transcript_118838:94-969(-)
MAGHHLMEQPGCAVASSTAGFWGTWHPSRSVPWALWTLAAALPRSGCTWSGRSPARGPSLPAPHGRHQRQLLDRPVLMVPPRELYAGPQGRRSDPLQRSARRGAHARPQLLRLQRTRGTDPPQPWLQPLPRQRRWRWGALRLLPHRRTAAGHRLCRWGWRCACRSQLLNTACRCSADPSPWHPQTAENTQRLPHGCLCFEEDRVYMVIFYPDASISGHFHMPGWSGSTTSTVDVAVMLVHARILGSRLMVELTWPVWSGSTPFSSNLCTITNPPCKPLVRTMPSCPSSLSG